MTLSSASDLVFGTVEQEAQPPGPSGNSMNMTPHSIAVGFSGMCTLHNPEEGQNFSVQMNSTVNQNKSRKDMDSKECTTKLQKLRISSRSSEPEHLNAFQNVYNYHAHFSGALQNKKELDTKQIQWFEKPGTVLNYEKNKNKLILEMKESFRPPKWLYGGANVNLTISKNENGEKEPGETPLKSTARVNKVYGDRRIVLTISEKSPEFEKVKIGVKVWLMEFYYAEPLKRMLRALDSLRDNFANSSSPLIKLLLGCYAAPRRDLAISPKPHPLMLNELQCEAWSLATVAKPPPCMLILGTNAAEKTTTLVQIIMTWLEQDARVLLTAPTNQAVDKLLDSIHSGIKNSNLIESKAVRLTQIIRLGRIPEKQDLKVFHFERLTKSFASRHGLNLGLEKDFKETQRKILHGAKLVVATCSTVGSDILDQTFTHVLLDEASLCVEPEALMPILKAVQSSAQLVISGSPCTIPQTGYGIGRQTGLDLSVLKRLLLLEQATIVRLNKE